MKAKLSGIIAIVGAILAVVYMALLVIDIIPYMAYLDGSAYIRLFIGLAGAAFALVGAINSLIKKSFRNILLLGLSALLLVVYGCIVMFAPLLILAIIGIVASIAVEYLVK